MNTITKGRGQYVCGDVGMRKRKDTNNTTAREKKHHAGVPAIHTLTIILVVKNVTDIKINILTIPTLYVTIYNMLIHVGRQCIDHQ